MTVSVNVIRRTTMSLLGELLTSLTNLLQPLMLYATWKRIAAMQGIGMSFA